MDAGWSGQHLSLLFCTLQAAARRLLYTSCQAAARGELAVVGRLFAGSLLAVTMSTPQHSAGSSQATVCDQLLGGCSWRDCWLGLHLPLYSVQSLLAAPNDSVGLSVTSCRVEEH